MTLTELLQQQTTGTLEHIDLSEHNQWVIGLDSPGYWNLFQAWGAYAGSSDPNVRRTQRYEIEGWLIDTIFVNPNDDWWCIRDFLNDYHEYMSEPMAVADTDAILTMLPIQRNMVLGAYLALAVNVYKTLRSSDMSNERIRGLFTVIALDWLDWWSRSNISLEVLDIDSHQLDYAEFSEAARLLGALFEQADEDETDDVDEDEPDAEDLEE